MGLGDKEKAKPGRKPGQRRRTPTERARDTRLIASLKLRRRLSAPDIAEEINGRFYSSPGETAHVSDKQVEKVITDLNKRALAEASKDMATLRAISIAECEEMERFCLDEFDKSAQAKLKRGTKKKAITIKTGTGEESVFKPATLTEALKERIHRDGNPNWIELYYKFRNRRYELMGIDPPKKIAPTNPAGDKPFEFTGTEELRRLTPLFEKFMKAQEKGGK